MSTQLLSDEVRERTARLHETSERSHLMTVMMSGTVTAADHATLMGQLWFIYQALESGAPQFVAEGAAIAPLLDERLNRLESLERDLTLLVGADFGEKLTALPATQAYATMISDAVRDRCEPRFLAHHYTRYLGDLSGGIMIGRNIAAVTGLGADDSDGVRFYEFPTIPKPMPFKRAYAESLNALDWDTSARELFVRTACDAYLANEAMFTDIDAAAEGRAA